MSPKLKGTLNWYRKEEIQMEEARKVIFKGFTGIFLTLIYMSLFQERAKLAEEELLRGKTKLK